MDTLPKRWLALSLLVLSALGFMGNSSGYANPTEADKPQDITDADPKAAAEREGQFLTNMRQLTFEGRRAGEGYFSRDGSQLVFQSERQGGNPFFQIYVMDLETGEVSLGNEVYDAIVGVHYLHRPLFPALVAALRPHGLLLYETFTTAQAARGHPKNPAFLLKPGELLELVAPLKILRQREGEFEDREVAAVVARKD